MIEERIDALRQAYAAYPDPKARDTTDLVTSLYGLLLQALEASEKDLAHRQGERGGKQLQPYTLRSQLVQILESADLQANPRTG